MGKKLIFTGDSITDCDHIFDQDDYGDGYVMLIHQALPEYEVVNRGFEGFTLPRLKGYWEKLRYRDTADVVTILIGINDVSRHLYGGGPGPEEYGRMLSDFAGFFEEKFGAEIVLMEPFLFRYPEEYQTWIPVLEKFRVQVRTLAREKGYLFVPLWDIFEKAQEGTNPLFLTPDGIHLMPKANRILADAWLKSASEGKIIEYDAG